MTQARVARTTKTRRPRLLSLCSGIGGIDLAAEMAGFEIAGQCEIDAYCQQVLARHWPTVKRIADIRSVWGDTFRGRIDVIAAGFPCQPASVAGQRRGRADARWLWPEVLRVVQIYEPTWMLLENVSGLISLGLDGVLADLDVAGYESWPLVFPAAAVGAPHQRERVFVMAHTAQHGQSLQPQVTGVGRPLDGASVRAGSGVERGNTAARISEHERIERDGSAVVADANGEWRPQPQGRVASIGRWAGDGGEDDDAGCDEHTESRMGREFDGLPRRLDGAHRHAWPAGPGQAQHPWEPPRVTHERIPHRAARVKALGNAVVPQQVFPILAAIAEVMK